MGLDLTDLLRQLRVLAFLDPANVDDHVHLVSTIRHSVACHKAFGSGGGVAVREADNGTDGKLVPHILLRLSYKRSRDADGGGLVLHAIITDGFDLLPGSCLGKKCVVAFC